MILLGIIYILKSDFKAANVILLFRDLQDARKKLNDMENKRKNSGEEAERLRNAVQEASEKAKIASKEVRYIYLHC